MPTCPCGDPVKGNGGLCRRCASLRILGVGPDATLEEIKAAYYILVKVWHPDRFQTDKTLKEAADSKLKDVNASFEFLRSQFSKNSRGKPPGNTQRDTTHEAPRTKPATGPNPGSNTKSTLDMGLAWRSFAWVIPARRIFFRLIVLAFVFLLARYVWIAFDFGGSPDDNVAKVYRYGKEQVLNGLEEPKRRFVEAIEQDLRRLNPLQTSPTPVAVSQNPETPPAQGVPSLQKPHEKTISPERMRSQTSTRKISPYITLGSTKAEVVDQLGDPTASSEKSLVYGRSELFLKDLCVIGWRVDPTSPIRVKLWPESPVDPGLDHFDVGSSKDVVLVVQGTPTAFSPDKFEYGGSEVFFKDNRVVGWKSDPTSIKLRAGTP
jgi:DnaJ domain